MQRRPVVTEPQPITYVLDVQWICGCVASGWLGQRGGVEWSAGDGRHRPADPQPTVRLRADLDGAGSPGELALVDQHGLAGEPHAVAKQVACGWPGCAAGRDIFEPAGVVPGAALRAVRVEHVREITSAGCKQLFETG